LNFYPIRSHLLKFDSRNKIFLYSEFKVWSTWVWSAARPARPPGPQKGIQVSTTFHQTFENKTTSGLWNL